VTERIPIVDADVHVNDAPAALAPYCAMPWRLSIEALATTPARYLDVPGYAPSLKLDPPIPGGHAARSVHTAAEMREGLAALGIEVAVLFPDHLLLFATIPHPEYALELSRAYNRWLIEEWLGEPGLHGAILACPQDPDASARDIAEFARVGKIAAIFLPTAGVNPLWGHRRYDPILAAAQEADLPVVLHSVTVVSPAFPCQLDQFENHFARQVLSHSFAMMANLVSLIQSGVPARYPRLRIVFTEAGVGWVPYFAWRLDRYHGEYRRMVPVLERRPSEYLREQMWFSTQPLEEPDDPAQLADVIRLVGEDRVIYASDWPHHDFDHPRAIGRLPLSPEVKRKILGENALAAFTRLEVRGERRA
jgi:predicted TIM-barrel fold metal-dependent hydrolase